MTVYRETEFKDATIYLDHDAYIRCGFERCTLVFSGGALGPIVEGRFLECRWIFDGPAKTTVEILRIMLSVQGVDQIVAAMLGLVPAEQTASADQSPTGQEPPQL